MLSVSISHATNDSKDTKKTHSHTLLNIRRQSKAQIFHWVIACHEAQHTHTWHHFGFNRKMCGGGIRAKWNDSLWIIFFKCFVKWIRISCCVLDRMSMLINWVFIVEVFVFLSLSLDIFRRFSLSHPSHLFDRSLQFFRYGIIFLFASPVQLQLNQRSV